MVLAELIAKECPHANTQSWKRGSDKERATHSGGLPVCARLASPGGWGKPLHPSPPKHFPTAVLIFRPVPVQEADSKVPFTTLKPEQGAVQECCQVCMINWIRT